MYKPRSLTYKFFQAKRKQHSRQKRLQHLWPYYPEKDFYFQTLEKKFFHQLTKRGPSKSFCYGKIYAPTSTKFSRHREWKKHRQKTRRTLRKIFTAQLWDTDVSIIIKHGWLN